LRKIALSLLLIAGLYIGYRILRGPGAHLSAQNTISEDGDGTQTETQTTKNFHRNSEASSSSSTAMIREAPLQKSRQPATLEVLRRFLNQKDSRGKWQISRFPDGRPAHILGGRIALHENYTATQVLKEVAQAMGLPDDALRSSAERQSANTYVMDEYYRGYPVLGANIKAFTTTRNDEIYHIANETREITAADLTVKLSGSDAIDQVRSRYKLDDDVRIHVTPSPWLYGSGPEENYLVYQVQFTTQSPHFSSHEVLVGAGDGRTVDHVLQRPALPEF
jgi:hypothetical protein